MGNQYEILIKQLNRLVNNLQGKLTNELLLVIDKLLTECITDKQLGACSSFFVFYARASKLIHGSTKKSG